MNKPELSLMTTDYHRTHPLFSGAVSIDGAKLKVCPPPVQGDACYKPVYEQFDVAEMSLSWYVMARCRGEPLIALPIFPLRMFIQPYLFCREPSAINRPEDLQGKRIGIQQYRITVGLWARGILQGTPRRRLCDQASMDHHASRKARDFEFPPTVKLRTSGTRISKRFCSTANSTR